VGSAPSWDCGSGREHQDDRDQTSQPPNLRLDALDYPKKPLGRQPRMPVTSRRSFLMAPARAGPGHAVVSPVAAKPRQGDHPRRLPIHDGGSQHPGRRPRSAACLLFRPVRSSSRHIDQITFLVLASVSNVRSRNDHTKMRFSEDGVHGRSSDVGIGRLAGLA
jgi:hypothetical protein